MNSEGPISSASVYTDFSGLTALKAKARGDQKAATAEVAQQFEAMFLQMMLKTMRQASLAKGLFDGEAMQKYRDLHDQQMAVHLAESGGIGLADVIEKQLAGGANIVARKNRTVTDYLANALQMPAVAKPQQYDESAIKAVDKSDMHFDGSAKTFIDKLKPYAEKAAAMLGLQPQALLAQAALETGWGKSQIKTNNGNPSFNLFGIKANKGWQGKQATVSTLEFRDGVALKEKASFRAYDSYQDAFDDYVAFIAGNKRYEQAVNNTADPQAYFSALQKAGYATDPDYASKIMSIYKRDDIHQAFESAVASEES